MLIELDNFELTLDLTVQAYWHKGYTGRRERGSGIPLEPDGPSGWEIVSVHCRDIPITHLLSDSDINRIKARLWDEDIERQS